MVEHGDSALSGADSVFICLVAQISTRRCRFFSDLSGDLLVCCCHRSLISNRFETAGSQPSLLAGAVLAFDHLRVDRVYVALSLVGKTSSTFAKFSRAGSRHFPGSRRHNLLRPVICAGMVDSECLRCTQRPSSITRSLRYSRALNSAVPNWIDAAGEAMVQSVTIGSLDVSRIDWNDDSPPFVLTNSRGSGRCRRPA